MCPRLAPTASFAGFYNCIVLLYFSSNFCVAMAEQFCSNSWRNNFDESKIWDDPSKMTKEVTNLWDWVSFQFQFQFFTLNLMPK